jgi:hypothetical protein
VLILSYGDCELQYGQIGKLNSLVRNNNLSVPAVNSEIRYEKQFVICSINCYALLYCCTGVR